MASIRASAGSALESGWAHAAYVLAIAAMALGLPPSAYAHSGAHVFLLIGAIGFWRYGWGVLHFLRSIYYRRVVFPRMQAAVAGGEAKHFTSYFLVTSYRIDAETTERVYRAAVEAAKRAPGPAVIIASIVDMADQRLVKSVFEELVQHGEPIELDIVRIPGTGKRDALAHAFRAIARRHPSPLDLAAVIDGDSIVPADLVERCAPFFHRHPKVGALTTHEVCEVDARPIFRHWWSLRFAQRQILMCSMGLSRRVLTLTGRMSMFRASIVTDPNFISQVETDYIDHWRLGRFKFLTGDDKSSWFWLLKNGYEMLYLPDLTVVTVERPPSDSFIASARMLMVRWFGNMLRTNTRAIKLGPRRIGLFTWLAVLDQRISMWTCLIGPVTATYAALFTSPSMLVVYAVWVLSTRYFVSLSMLSVQRRVSIAYPFLLYFNQVFGSLIKIYILFRLDRQRWTRQNTVGFSTRSTLKALRLRFEAVYIHALSLAAFILCLGWVMGFLPFPTGRGI